MLAISVAYSLASGVSTVARRVRRLISVLQSAGGRPSASNRSNAFRFSTTSALWYVNAAAIPVDGGQSVVE